MSILKGTFFIYLGHNHIAIAHAQRRVIINIDQSYIMQGQRPCQTLGGVACKTTPGSQQCSGPFAGGAQANPSFRK